MADSDRMILAYVEESSFATVPSPAAQLTELRVTSESLKMNSTLTPSQEIRSDRQTADVVRTEATGGGDISFELSYGSHDALIEAAMGSAGWSSPVSVTDKSDLAVTAPSGNTFTIVASGATDLSVFSVGQWVRVSGFATPGNNGFFKVVARVTATLTLTGKVSAVEAENNSGLSVNIVQGAQIVNGVESRSFLFEKEFTDLSNQFSRLLGFAPDTFALNVAADGIITATIGWLGAREESASATAGTGTNIPPGSSPVMSGVDSVLDILYNYTTPLDASTFNFTLSGNLRTRQKIGTLGPFSLGMGNVALSGGVSVFFENSDEIDDYANNTESSLAVLIQDGSGNGYVVDIPRMKFTDGQRVAGGQNQDILAEMELQGFRHATEDVTIRIQRFAA